MTVGRIEFTDVWKKFHYGEVNNRLAAFDNRRPIEVLCEIADLIHLDVGRKGRHRR